MAPAEIGQRAGHPAPDRQQVGLAPLIVGLAGGPAAWSVAWMVSVVLAQEACRPGRVLLASPAFGGVQASLAAINGLACLITIVSGVVAYRSWRKTEAEHGGSTDALLEIGEGRTRFMAMAGILTSAGFLLAILFGVPAIVFGPRC